MQGRRWSKAGPAAEGKWAYPLPSLGVRGITPGALKTEDIGSNLCNLMHFEVIK